MPPKKKQPKRPPCSPDEVIYKRENKKFCRSKSKSPKKQETSPSTKEEKQLKEQFPVEAPNREACMRKYSTEKNIQLGEGKNASIVPACENKDCKYVLKISNQISGALRDAFFLNYLKDKTLKDGSPIVPHMYDHWLCKFPDDTGKIKQHFFMVVDRWDSDMQALAVKQQKNLNALYKVYTKDQLVQMFGLAFVLGKLNVVHSDLKPDQYLQRNNGKNIVVTDFGFSGKSDSPYMAEIGWSGFEPGKKPEIWGCAPFYSLLDYNQKSPDFPTWMNIIQLELYIVGAERAHVLHEGKLYDFGGIRDFARKKYSKRLCTEWAETWADYSTENSLYLTMAEIAKIS